MASGASPSGTGCDTRDPAEMVHPRERAHGKSRGRRPGEAELGRADVRRHSGRGGARRDRQSRRRDLYRWLAPEAAGGVGDSPFVGAGLFADNRSAAVSTTGHGERIIPLVWAKAAADLVEHGDAAPQAAASAVALLDRLDAKGGLIVLDRRGNAGVAWNTPAMAFAVWSRGATEIEDGLRE